MAVQRQREAVEMPFLDHLEELRWRIIKALSALIVGVGAAFAVITRFDVIGLLERPIAPYRHWRRRRYPRSCWQRRASPSYA